jgi:ATP-dependent DNA helicase PIF1
LPWTTTTSFNFRKNFKLKEHNIIDKNRTGYSKHHNSSEYNDNNNINEENLSVRSDSHAYLQKIDTNVYGTELSDEQQKVLDLILTQRKNVFFTGSAGTGKSFLLKIIIKKLQTRYGKNNIGISAPTGLAAANIGGQTIQRLFNIGLGKEPKEILLNKIKNNMDKYMSWRKLTVLIIDEVSMLDSELLEKLNYLAKKIKRSESPFGGIQVIISGDFLQLPPITKANLSTINYCFKSNAWKEIVDENVILTKVFRQRGDSELIDILNSLRIGNINHKIENKLRQLSRPINFNDGIEPTELFPTRNEVDKSNLIKLNQLEGPEVSYNCRDVSLMGAPIDEKIRRNFDLLMCAQVLKLKVGAQVMLIKNDPERNLVNGQLGIVETFLTKPIFQSFMTRFGNDFQPAKMIILRKIGLILLNKKKLTNVPENDDLSLVDEYTAELINELLRSYDPKDELLPLVKFSTKDEFQSIPILVDRTDFSPDFASNNSQNLFVRRQLPIILSWSMSIHKSQGQTLQRVKVDLRKIFEKGQLYVAISRCVSSKGLQVLNFDRRKVFVDEEVISFYNSISK